MESLEWLPFLFLIDQKHVTGSHVDINLGSLENSLEKHILQFVLLQGELIIPSLNHCNVHDEIKEG